MGNTKAAISLQVEINCYAREILTLWQANVLVARNLWVQALNRDTRRHIYFSPGFSC